MDFQSIVVELDETGCCLNITSDYGRSEQGKRVYDTRQTHPGTRINTVAVLQPFRAFLKNNWHPLRALFWAQNPLSLYYQELL